MPAVNAFERRAETSLREILSKTIVGSLPKQVQESSSFQWLMRHDNVLGRRHEQTLDHEFSHSRLARSLSHMRSGMRFGRGELAELLSPIVARLLTPTLQAYYATATDIAHRWRQAIKRVRWSEDGLRPENLQETSRANTERLRKIGGVDEEQLSKGIAALLQGAFEVAQQQCVVLEKRWREWEREVDDIRRDIDTVDEGIENMEASDAMLTVSLRLLGLSAGRSAGRVPKATEYPLGVQDLLLIAIMSGARGGGHGFGERHLEHYLSHVEHLLHEQTYGPSRRREIDRLRQKYGDQNPFDLYSPLGRPVDSGFLELIDEHNHLPGGGRTEYSEAWQRRLVEDPWSHEDTPFFAAADDERAVERAAAWADSKIKREVWCYEKRPRGVETLDDMMRRVWLAEWVKGRIRKMKVGSEGKQAELRWTSKAAFAFIDAVRRRLNQQGYSLAEISPNEEDALWDAKE
jgi:hypothetical protein